MRKFLLLIIICLPFTLTGQIPTIQYDYENNRFGQNQPLPAEEWWILQGFLPPDIRMVELSIYESGKIDKGSVYTSEYRLLDGTESNLFTIPVNHNLKGNHQYTVTLSYFERASQEEIDRLNTMVIESLESYLNLSTVATRSKIELSKHPKLIMQDLNHIMEDGLSLYRNRLGVEFDGFSNIVYDKLEQIDDLSLRKAKFNVFARDEVDTEREKRIAYFKENMRELAGIIEREVRQYLSYNFYVLSRVRTISNYNTEKTRTVLPVNLGYAAVYLNNPTDELDNIEDTEWDGAPMVGISVPLGNPNLNAPFWSNSSISAGVLLQNLEFGDAEYTGPVVERPIYLAYGYKTAYFLRFNAGATILSDPNDNIEFSPFFGVTVEINLWLGLSR